MNRSEELKQAAEQFNAEHDRWANNDNRSYPDAEYWTKLENMLNVFADGDIPGNCRQLSEAVRNLEFQLNIFDNSDSPSPTDSFWSAREALAHAFEQCADPPRPKPLESIRTLNEQKVPHEQIARMYRLTDKHGNGRADLIARELAEPGSVIGPDWVDPRILDWQETCKASQEEIDAIDRQRAEASQTCPESPDELFLQGVGIHQAAKMLRMPISEIDELWKKLDREYQQKLRTATQGAGLDARGIGYPAVETIPELLESEEVDYSTCTLDELKSMAKSAGIAIRGNQGRETLVAKLQQLEEVNA